MLQRCFLRPCSEEGSDAAKPWHGFGENTDCGNREEIDKLTLRFLGWASSHQQTWTIEWKQTLNNRWSQQRRYVTGRLQWYPQDTAESFVKWSSAGLLHSPANVRVLEMKFYICSDVTHTHLLRNILSNYWCGVHRSCTNNPLKSDRRKLDEKARKPV